MDFLSYAPWALQNGTNFVLFLIISLFLIIFVIVQHYAFKRMEDKQLARQYAEIILENIRHDSDIEWEHEYIYNLLHHCLCDLYESLQKKNALNKDFKRRYKETFEYVKKNMYVVRLNAEVANKREENFKKDKSIYFRVPGRVERRLAK
jgi:hypothetical protein